MLKTVGGKRRVLQRCPSLAPSSTLGDVRCELMLVLGTNAPHAGFCCAVVPGQARITWLRRNISTGTVLRVFQVGDDLWVAETPEAARRYAGAKHGSMAAADKRRKGIVEVPGTTTINVLGANPDRPTEKTVEEWLRESAAAGMSGTME